MQARTRQAQGVSLYRIFCKERFGGRDHMLSQRIGTVSCSRPRAVGVAGGFALPRFEVGKASERGQTWKSSLVRGPAAQVRSIRSDGASRESLSGRSTTGLQLRCPTETCWPDGAIARYRSR